MENGPDLSGLLGRLRRLEDMEAARNHLHRYAATLDAPTAESIAALFTEDGVLRTRLGEFTGREAIAGFYRDRLAADPSEKRHFIVSPRTTWTGPGTVEIASYFLFTARAGTSVLGWGTYLDRLRVRGRPRCSPTRPSRSTWAPTWRRAGHDHERERRRGSRRRGGPARATPRRLSGTPAGPRF
ncbi:nuclear transport factor 2 family protein [Actinomadura madurae]|uniref:nuclear transport factor 2 family protein n=1 Tax=Actinomadura madurae TaxID=1993 RepID=UPI0020D22F12|nr:nuclear transport factor 2 family protein [Actinomadura madurae]MCQ0013659.1 nuclear transport factor 2 family protein [Actinomadura madurae]